MTLNRTVSPLTEASAAAYTSTDYAYDYAIGGLPFLSAASDESPYIRETAPYRKEQFDAAQDVGEQSLVYWWLKSQSSFHGGAGQKYLDTALNDDPLQPIRFDTSLGVNVWTPGQVTLLRQAPANVASTVSSQRLLGAVDGSTPVYFLAAGSALSRCTGSASSAVTWGGTGTILSLATDGSNYLAADSTGIYRGTLAGGAGSKLWDTGSSKVTIAWVKQRLVAGIGNKFYELDGSGPTLPAAKYTHPNSGWQWTSIVEGPSAIYAAGYAGSTSAIIKFTLDASGVVPTLTSAVQVAEMPPGEQITCLFTYLGSLMGIGTNRGVRVAEIGSDGSLAYGPVVFSTPTPVRGMVGDDRFLYVGAGNGLDGKSGLYRVDLAQPLPFGGYAYATDLQAKVAGEVSGVSLLGTRLVFVVEGSGSYLQSDSLYEPSGTLTTSRIRYGTVEPKLLKYVRLRAAPLAGGLAVSYTGPNGTTTRLGSFNTAGTTDLDELSVNSQPVEFASLTFTLSATADQLDTPEFRSYQLKALPAAKRQRLMRLPMLCFDVERDRSGQQLNGVGSALRRLEALEALEEAGDAVLFQHFEADGRIRSRLVVIDEVRFIQQDPPSNANGWGGVVLATLRSVT
jgi:hypothetical protein